MNRMNWTWKKSRGVRGLFVLMLLFLCSCSAVQHFFGVSGTDVLLADNPLGVIDLKSGTLMTLAESKPISGNQLEVKFSNTTEQKRTELVAAKFGDELRLIDFLIPGVNEKPQLSFASTARGLVFINPLFLGLPFEARVAIFQDIPKHPEFETLKRKVTSSKSLSEDNLIETEMKIAIDIAKKRGILTSSSVTSNKGLNAGNRESSKPNSATESSSDTSFDRESFPKALCGDSLPSDSKAYPVDLYPVFTDYSEQNLQIVTTELCQDAIRLTRQKTNKQSIQIGSFIEKTRAEEFKNFIQKKLGNAEVGEPTRIESKRSSLPNYLAGWLIPSASAQAPTQSTTNLEYKITQKLDDDCLSFNSICNGYPLWHGYELQSSSDGIKIAGGSILAQQIIVVPKGKLKTKGLTNDDYGGKKLLEQDVVAELLLEPQDVGIWDGSVIKTVSGGSRTEQVITPRNGGKWKHGDYVVLISAGAKLNRKNDKQPYGALEKNIANEITDMLTLAGGTLLAESVSNIGAIVSDCVLSNDLGEILNCVQKQDNRFKIAGAFGVKNEDVVQKFFTIVFQRENWIKQAKIIGKGISIPDRGISLSRNIVLGQYLARENQKGIYSAEISIIDLASAPRNIELRCSREKTEILDMEIQLGGGLFCPGELTVKNYSNYAVEFLNKGADSFLVLPNDVNNDKQSFSFNGRIYRDEVGTAEVGIGGSRTSIGTVYKFPFTVQRLDTRLPEKDITFNCDDKDLPVKWGLKITPKCTETGTYAEYENYSLNYPIDVIFADKVISLRRREYGSGGSGTLRSSSRTVTIKIRANLN